MKSSEGRFLMPTEGSDLLRVEPGSGRNLVVGATAWIAVATVAMAVWSVGPRAAEAVGGVEDLEVTPSLTREIQFMLLRLGMEPGPIDGVIGPQTIKALQKFEK